ncbi:MAG: S16 family serine protease [Candidatus Micrarchaeota archaeon]
MRQAVLFALAILVAAQAASMYAPAVNADGKGGLTLVEARAVPGKNEIFVAVTPLTGVDTQQSEKLAVKIAADEAGVDQTKYDVLFKIKSDAEIVDGPSAGAAMALLTYSEFSKAKLRADLTITGTIERDGSMGKVGGVFEKTVAIVESRKFKVFLVPKGQAIQNGVDLREYGRKEGVQVVEVKDIGEAIKFATTEEGTVLEVKEEVLPPLALAEFPVTETAEPFRRIAKEQVDEASRLASGLKDQKTAIAVAAREAVGTSRKMWENGYWYSAANTAFLTTVALEENGLLNASKEEMVKLFKDLEAERDAIAFAEPTAENAEWLAAAKMRWYWASRRLGDGTRKARMLPAAFVVEDYALAKYWILAARKMNAVAENIGGRKISELAFRDAASELLAEADQRNDDGMLEDEDRDNLESAKEAFQNSDYLTAALNAEFVMAFSDANEETGGMTFSEMFEYVCDNRTTAEECVPKDRLETTSPFAELYEAHGYYYVQEANRTQQSEYLVNAVKMLRLSAYIEELFANASSAPEATPRPSYRPTITPEASAQIVVSVSASVPQQNSARDIALLLLAAIVVLIAVLAFSVGRRMTSSREQREDDARRKLERLDELLVEGRISERNYDRLREKYSARPAGKEEKPPAEAQKEAEPEAPEEEPAAEDKPEKKPASRSRGRKRKKKA